MRKLSMWWISSDIIEILTWSSFEPSQFSTVSILYCSTSTVLYSKAVMKTEYICTLTSSSTVSTRKFFQLIKKTQEYLMSLSSSTNKRNFVIVNCNIINKKGFKDEISGFSSMLRSDVFS